MMPKNINDTKDKESELDHVLPVDSFAEREPQCCCWCCFRTNRVTPLKSLKPDGKLIEIRPGRYIRILHINGTSDPRNVKSAENRVNPETLPGSPARVKDSENVQSTVQNQTAEYIVSGDVAPCQSDTKNVQTSMQIEGENKDENKLNTGGRHTTASGVRVELSQNGKLSKDESKNTTGNSSNSVSKHSGTVLFFFHGVGGSADVWQAQLDHFESKGFEMVVPDMIGHGLSMNPYDLKHYTFQEIEKDVLTIFDKYCKRKNILIGHSYGCSFTSALARKRSQQIQKLIMISGGSPTPLQPQPGFFSLPECILQCFRPILQRGFTKSAISSVNRNQRLQTQAFSIPTYVLKNIMNGQTWPEGNSEFHQQINIPCMLIHGIDDKLITISDELEMQEAIYGSQLEVVKDASHMVMMEQPAIVNTIISKFLAIDNAEYGSPRRAVSPFGNRITRASTMSLRSSKSIPRTTALVAGNARS